MMHLTLRSIVVGAATALSLPRAAFAQGETLASAAARAGIVFGTAVGSRGFAMPEYRALVERECAVITPPSCPAARVGVWPT